MNDLFFILLAIAAALLTATGVYRFTTLSRDEQAAKIKEWLLWAVILAEKEYGGGMGKVKLREVYAKFVETWPQVASWMSFEAFSELVDEALQKMKSMLNTNQELYNYIKGYKEVKT